MTTSPISRICHLPRHLHPLPSSHIVRADGLVLVGGAMAEACSGGDCSGADAAVFTARPVV